MSYKFTARVQKLLFLAQQEAERHKHNLIGTEHLLFGLIKLGSGVALEILKDLGIDLQDLENEIQSVMKNQKRISEASGLDYSPNAKKVLEISSDVARSLKNDFVGTEHLLIAILEEGEGTGAQILKKYHIDVDDVRLALYDLYGLRSRGQVYVYLFLRPETDSGRLIFENRAESLLESGGLRSYSFPMIDTADSYLYRIEKKIDKLTTRLFMVSPQDRVELTSRIEKLKQRRKDYQLNKARIRVPEGLARQSRRMNAPCPR